MFLDLDQDLVPGAAEPSAVTDVTGRFNLTLPEVRGKRGGAFVGQILIPMCLGLFCGTGGPFFDPSLGRGVTTLLLFLQQVFALTTCVFSIEMGTIQSRPFI